MTVPHDEPERDAWLSEALRHAPDANAVPPAELSEAILRQARNAVKVPQPAARARPHGLMQWWSWLARPSVAAGFATVMVAVLVGVMWWDRPLDESLPPREAPAAVPAPAPAREEAKSIAQAAPENEATRPTEKPARSAPTQAPTTAKRERAAADPAPMVSAKKSNEQVSDAAAPAPAPTSTPAPTPFPESAAKSGGGAARDEAAEQRSERATGSLSSVAPAPVTAAPAPPPKLALRQQSAVDALTPLANPPERWTWQRGAGIQAMTPALQGWLAQLNRAARWRSADGAVPSPADGPVLQLRHDGTLHSTIQISDSAAWLTPTDGPPVMAPLSPATTASLKAALLAATP